MKARVLLPDEEDCAELMLGGLETLLVWNLTNTSCLCEIFVLRRHTQNHSHQHIKLRQWNVGSDCILVEHTQNYVSTHALQKPLPPTRKLQSILVFDVLVFAANLNISVWRTHMLHIRREVRFPV